VTLLRRLLLDHRTLTLWLALAALTVKLLVPAGFMVGSAGGQVVLQMCSGFGPVVAAPMAHGARADGHGGGHQQPDHPGADMPCPYTALAHGVGPALDPVLLVLAIAFAMALGFAGVVGLPLRPAAYWRPFLRGPPISS
jgi:hypothetical protein